MLVAVHLGTPKGDKKIPAAFLGVQFDHRTSSDAHAQSSKQSGLHIHWDNTRVTVKQTAFTTQGASIRTLKGSVPGLY